MESEKRIFYRKLWGLVFPIAIQNLMTALVSASDAFMLGFVSQTSLSAVSLATQIQFVHNLFMLALTIGATTLAAQYWGKGDTDSVEEILAIVLKISMAVSVVFFIAAMFFSGFLMRIFTNDIRLIQAGIPYLRIVSVSYLFMGFSQIYLCIMKNSQKYADWFFFNDIEYHIQCDFYIWNIRNSGYGNSGCCHSNCISCVYSAGMDIK